MKDSEGGKFIYEELPKLQEIMDVVIDENISNLKKEGQKLILRPDWEDVKVVEMFLICENKFAQNPELKKLLLQTGEEILVEGNDWDDTFWGVCGGVGENKLGRILMMVRESMRTMHYRI